ncbi:MAG TPA: hypothetical protein VFD47_00235 [Actinomycetota bacterium]|nr:hypothetical protein [Actinomycetota bacterium]
MGGTKQDLRTVVIAVVAAAVTGLAVPAVSAVVRATNADKVDGRHAVGSGATQAERARRLVATGKNGKLPNGIIAKAPNADKLDGLDSTDLMRGSGPGRSVVNGPGCDPTTSSYVSCGAVQLKLPRRGRVMLTMDGAWATSTAPSIGRCRFFGPGTSNQQVNLGEPTDSATDHFFGLNEVTKRVSGGTRTFGLECREFAADTISFKEIMLSAVYVGNL